MFLLRPKSGLMRPLYRLIGSGGILTLSELR